MDRREKALYHQIHPAKLVTDWGTAALACVLLWHHDLIIALLVGLVPPVVATMILLRWGELESYKSSRLGRYLRRYMTRGMEGLRLAGLVVAWGGAWLRLWPLIVLGLVVIAVAWARGRLWPESAPEIVPYDATWPQAFSAERDQIAAVLGDLAIRIDHHGSTAVVGLAAKPVIDIQVSVRRLQPIEEYAAPLSQLGYVHVPHPDDAFAPFFHRPARWPHTHHVHVVQSGGAEERRTLAFRDYLREHPGVAHEYQELKRGLAARHGTATFGSQQAYADAKTAFVTRITERALAEGLPRELQMAPLNQRLRPGTSAARPVPGAGG